METPLFGTNLCNLLCNRIIKEFDTVDEYHSTEIKVINLEQFIVVKGKTTINNSINYSQLFKNYLNDVFKINKDFNVIDLITYGDKVDLNIVSINLSLENKNEEFVYSLSKNIQGEYNIDLDKNIIFHNNNNLFQYLLDIPEYNGLEGKNIGDNYPYVSDSIFGKSLNSSKLYEIYLKYISYNLFEKQLCRDITFNMFYSGDLLNLNYENMDFDISSNSRYTSKEWLLSLILDLFDFNYNNIKKHLSLDTYDFSNEILSKDKCWMIRDKTSEMILL